MDVKICVIGAGNWGSNHIKTLIRQNIFTGCVEVDPNKINEIKKYYPEVLCYSSLNDSFSEEFDGYIISTPSENHYQSAIDLISKKKPVLVEKPLALSVNEAEKIKSALLLNKGKLMVGHLLMYHPAILKIEKLLYEGRIGSIKYIYSNRIQRGKIRSNENVLWSFAPHDIAVFQFFVKTFPKSVKSVGRDIFKNKIHDSVITHMKYPNGIEGHIFSSWINPFKEHKMVIIGTKGSILFEDSIEKHPIKLFENENQIINGKISLLKNKKPKKIYYDTSSPLDNELKNFINLINNNGSNHSDIDKGIEVIKILEMATKSLKTAGN